MDRVELIKKTKEYAKRVLSTDSTGHDWQHTKRVWQNACKIMSVYSDVDTLVVELAALLHDIADWKFHNGDETIGAKTAHKFLCECQVDEKIIEKVSDIILKLSFKGANVQNEITTLEGQIVQDADRLDAIGAIGVARALSYGAIHNRELYNPDIEPVLHDSFEAYKNSRSTTLNHFYEKLLLLKDRFNTEEAKKMALSRHKFMEDFLNQFISEWNGLI